MTSASVGADPELLGFLALFLLFAVVRGYRMTRGTSTSPTRLFALAGLYLFIFVIDVAADAVLFPYWFLGIDAVLLAVGALVTIPYVRRVVQIQRTPDGRWSYRLGFLLPGIYLALLAVRLGADVVLFGGLPTIAPAPGQVSGFALELLAVVDALFSISAGLIVGRSIAVYQALKEHEASHPPVGTPSDAPLPSGAPPPGPPRP